MLRIQPCVNTNTVLRYTSSTSVRRQRPVYTRSAINRRVNASTTVRNIGLFRGHTRTTLTSPCTRSQPMTDSSSLQSLELNENRFVSLLRNLIGEAEHLQNTGVGTAYVPQEDRAIKHVLEVLAPHRKENGGPLEIDHVTYAEGRGNLIIKYPGTGSSEDVLSFVGSHLDVVPANPDAWNVDPFSLTIDGDKLYGRGTTDCLGHVALMTTLFSQLAELKPELKTTLTCVFIASEEASGPGIGVDGLVAEGKLDHCKPGPVIWVDCADSQPCIGTAGAVTWHLSANGHRFHSGLPHKGINAIEMGMEAVSRIQQKFYECFPAGIACDLTSPAFKLMCDSIKDVKGVAEPYSLTGSLPLVHDMQSEGFDIQLIGFGLMSTYHADNEYCSLNDMKDAARILATLIEKFA
mmetsp:Transcript_2017/g.9716  ORF Transcript_2017/g.9716 Transcript_2017/m.9716 type:complete len:406 (+) Transcript_2017:528-1745(+)